MAVLTQERGVPHNSPYEVPVEADRSAVTTGSSPACGGVAQELAATFLLEYLGNTRAAYRSDLADWFGYCNHRGMDPLTARRADVAGYVDHLAQRGLGRSTVARRMTCLRGFYRYLVEDELLVSSPADRVRVRPPRPRRTPPLALEQVRALLAKADQVGGRTAALAWLLATTGARISGALGARVEDLRLGEDGGGFLDIVSKGDQPQTLLLTTAVVDRLRPLVEGRTDGLVFTTAAGRPWERNNATKDLQKVAARARIVAFTPHRLRATYITTARSVGCDLANIQDAVGHADPVTTRRYDHAVIDPAVHPTNWVSAALTGSAQPTPAAGRETKAPGSEGESLAA